MMVQHTIPERVYRRTQEWADRDEATGCLVSRYSVASHGYAQVGWNEAGERIVTLAHRATWIFVNGHLPEGHTVDHLCKNRKCVELNHLRALSNFDNARRTAGRDWPLGECIGGHPDTLLQTTPSGKRYCPVCKRDYQRRYRAKKKRIAAGSNPVV